MTELEIGAILDTHDALVRACLDHRLGFGEFSAAYGDFPASYALKDQTSSTDECAKLHLVRRRIAFHGRVADVLSGLRSRSGSGVHADVERFLPMAGLMRLRDLVSNHPKFEAERWTGGGDTRNSP
jgi:hypothetical protein